MNLNWQQRYLRPNMAEPKIPLDKMFKDLSTTQKMILMGEKLIGMITERTQKGEGVTGKDFKEYSAKSVKGQDPYWLRKKRGEFKRQASGFKPSKPGDVNLTLTSDMLNSFSVKEADEFQVTIGFPAQESIKAFQNEKMGRPISTIKNPVNKKEEKFIEAFWDKRISEAMKLASGTSKITVE